LTDRIFEIGERGIDAADERVKSLMNNMVNAETPGYKKSDVAIKAFPMQLESATKRLEGGADTMAPYIDGAYLSHAPGALIRTGNDTDLAIGGDGFFVIEGSFGEGYTRDGRFVVDNQGRLATAIGGHTVLSRGGPVYVPPGSKIQVTQTGEIKVNDQVMAELRIVKVPDPSKLDSMGGSIFRNPGNVMVEDVDHPKVIQGYIESSNVSMVDAMMELVVLSRIYNINTKVISTRDQNLSRALDMARMSP